MMAGMMTNRTMRWSTITRTVMRTQMWIIVVNPVPILLSIILVVAYIIGGAFLFQMWEGWSFLDSSYFCFITLTTIGFGDLTPDQRNDDGDGEQRIALCSLYLLFGIAMIAMSFNLLQEEVINSVKSLGKMCGIIKDNDDDEDY